MDGRSVVRVVQVTDTCINCETQAQQSFGWEDFNENYPLAQGWGRLDGNLFCSSCLSRERSFYP